MAAPPLLTIDEWRNDAEDLIRRYAAWTRADVEKVLNHPSGKPPTRVAVQALSEAAAAYAAEARLLLAKPESKDASRANHVADLTVIAEELEFGTDEAKSLHDPDEVWKGLDRRSKEIATQKVPVGRAQVAEIRARFRREKRGQIPPQRLAELNKQK